MPPSSCCSALNAPQFGFPFQPATATVLQARPTTFALPLQPPRIFLFHRKRECMFSRSENTWARCASLPQGALVDPISQLNSISSLPPPTRLLPSASSIILHGCSGRDLPPQLKVGQGGRRMSGHGWPQQGSLLTRMNRLPGRRALLGMCCSHIRPARPPTQELALEGGAASLPVEGEGCPGTQSQPITELCTAAPWPKGVLQKGRSL